MTEELYKCQNCKCSNLYDLKYFSFLSTIGFKDTPASYPSPHTSPHFIPPPAAALTLLNCGSLVEDLDCPADVQIEQSDGSSPLPLTFLLQGSQEGLHIDFRTPADPATETQGEATLLTVVPWHICLTIRAAPTPAALCCA